MRLKFLCAAFGLLIVLSACQAGSVPGADPERDAEARLLVEDLAEDRDDMLMVKMSSRVVPTEMAAQLPFMKTLVPEGPVPVGVTTGWRSNISTDGTTYVVARTYEYPDRILNAETTFIKQGDAWKVLGFYIAPKMKPAQETKANQPDSAPVTE